MIVELPVMFGSATLVAITMTVWTTGTGLEAVKRPVFEIAPAPAGLMLHVTAELPVPVTLDVNC